MLPTVRRHNWKVLGPWVQGLLPDRPDLLREWRRQFGIKDDNPLALLARVGEDLAGAVRFLRPERVEEALTAGDVIPVSEGDIATALRLTQAARVSSPSAGVQGWFSLAGAQPKIALYQDITGKWFRPTGNIPTTHIIKPVMASQPGQEVGEHMMMMLARSVGLTCAESTVATFEDIATVVVKRYDRREVHGSVQRVHQEDLAQALGVPPSRKYQLQGGPSPLHIVDHLRAHVAPEHVQEDVERFAQALIFNWLTVGTDAHAKNYSILLSGTQVRLAPLYDLNSFLAFGGTPSAALSMKIGSTYVADEVRKTDWTDVATLLGVDEDWMIDEITRQGGLIPGALLEIYLQLAVTGTDLAGAPTRLVEGIVNWCVRALDALAVR